MKVLSVRQPWAWLIFHGKDVENRDWHTRHRGPLAIHASAGMTKYELEDAIEFVATFDEPLAGRIPPHKDLWRSCIIGTVDLIACQDYVESEWFQGKYGLVLANPKLFEFPIAASGSLGLWNWTPPKTSNVSHGAGPITRDAK